MLVCPFQNLFLINGHILVNEEQSYEVEVRLNNI
jgi:hypothetical protein